ncbi:MAG: hypothetical protein R3A13_02235 [Bdellovibrionota bacterium]
MDRDTFRSKVIKLVQKSKKALRLYNSMGRLNTGEASELADQQVLEWKAINQTLIKTLTHSIEKLDNKQLSDRVFLLRDQFYTDWRSAEADLKTKQSALIAAVDNQDFIKSVGMSRDLAVLKSKMQASQAACHELQLLIDQNKLNPPAEPEPEDTYAIVEEVQEAKVIPLWGR